MKQLNFPIQVMLIITVVALTFAAVIYEYSKRRFEEREQLCAGRCYEKGFRAYNYTPITRNRAFAEAEDCKCLR